MRKRGSIAAIAIAVVTIGLAPGQAKERRAPLSSKVVIDVFGTGPPGTFAFGHIRSRKARCLRHRRVRIFAETESGEVRLGTDLSSHNGYWGKLGSGTGLTGFRIKMLPRYVGHGRRCVGDSDRKDWPPRQVGVSPRGDAFPTQVGLHAARFGPNLVEALGVVTAPHWRCRRNRLVRIFGISDGTPNLAGIDRASKNGYFGIDREAPAPGGVRAVAPPKPLPGSASCARGSTEVNP